MFDKTGKRKPYCRHICGYHVTDIITAIKIRKIYEWIIIIIIIESVVPLET